MPSRTAVHERAHRPTGISGLASLAAICLVGGTLLVASPAEAATRPVALSVLAVRTGTATAPGVALTGRLTRGGQPVAGRAVTVQVRTAGTTQWRIAKSARTGADGSVRVVRSALKRAKQFRVRYRDASASQVSQTVTIPVAATVSVTATSNPTPTAGDEVRLTGSTSPSLIGARIRLQLLVGDEWRSVSSTVVAPDGGYSVRAIATVGGDQRYRAFVPAAAGRPEIASTESTLTVYAWYRLARVASIPQAADGDALVVSRQAIAGRPFVDAVGRRLDQGGRAVSVWALGNRCLSFRSTIGPADDSDPGFYGVFRARADDDGLVDAELDRGSTRSVTADITGASALQLVSAASTGVGDAAWGDPEVLCAGL